MCCEKRISVVVCTYNGARYLREQLDSILAQDYQPVEIIVQDDGSSDDTFHILEEYAHIYQLIKVCRNEGQHGINNNFFSAMQRASGDYIALADQDDIWEHDKLYRQAEAIGEKLLCSGFSVPFSDDGFPVGHDDRMPNYDILRLAYLGVLPGHTLLMHRSLPDYVPNKNNCPYLYDWQLQMVAAAAESIVFVPHVLVHFRRHGDAATACLPVGHCMISSSAINYIQTTLLHHAALQRCVRTRFSYILQMLDELPFKTKAVEECREMARLQLQSGLKGFVKRTVFFLQHQTQLFHVTEKKSLLTACRALYFPFSCGYYYRAILKQHK